MTGWLLGIDLSPSFLRPPSGNRLAPRMLEVLIRRPVVRFWLCSLRASLSLRCIRATHRFS